MMAEAGVSLSMAANNMALVREFGLQFAVPRLPLANLHSFNIPEPYLEDIGAYVSHGFLKMFT